MLLSVLLGGCVSEFPQGKGLGTGCRSGTWTAEEPKGAAAVRRGSECVGWVRRGGAAPAPACGDHLCGRLRGF